MQHKADKESPSLVFSCSESVDLHSGCMDANKMGGVEFALKGGFLSIGFKPFASDSMRRGFLSQSENSP